MKKFLKTLGVLGGVLVLAVIGGVLYALTVDINDYKLEIEAAVKDATGRDFAIAGPIELRLGMTTQVKMTGVSLANAEWGSRPKMLEIDSLEAAVRILSLLDDAPDVTYFRLNGARALIETGPDGRRNTAFATAAEPARDGDAETKIAIPVLRQVDIRDVEVLITDGAKGAEKQFTLRALTLSAASAEAPMNFALNAEFDRMPIVMSGTLGAASAMKDSRVPWTVDLAGNLAGIDTRLTGSIREPVEGKGFGLTAKMTGKELAQVAKIAGVNVPKLGSFDAAATLTGGDGKLSVDPLTIRIGTADVIEVKIDGSIASLQDQSGIDLKIAAASRQVGNLNPLVEPYSDQRLPAIGPLNVSLRVVGDANKALAIRDLDLALGQPSTVLVRAGGSVASLQDAAGVDLNLALESPDLSVLNTAGLSVPSIKQVRLSVAAKSDRDGPVILDPITARVGGSDLKGTVRIASVMKSPKVVANLTSDYFNTADLGPPDKPKVGKAPAAESRGAAAGASAHGGVFSDAPLPLELLKMFEAEIDYTATRLVAAVSELHDFRTKVVVRNGKLTVSPLSAGVGAGALEAAMSLDAAAALPLLSLRVQGKKIDLEPLLAGAGFKDRITGPLDIDIDLAGSGHSPRSVAASLAGKVQASVYGSRIHEKTLRDALGNLIVDRFSTDKGWVVVDCAVFDYGVAKGVMQTNAGYVASGPASVKTRGTIDLAAERFDLGVKASGANVVSVPLVVAGPLTGPQVAPDPKQALLAIGAGVLTGGIAPALMLFLGDLPQGHPCVQAIEAERQREEQQQSAPQRIMDDAVKSIEGVGRGVGDTLKGLFGK